MANERWQYQVIDVKPKFFSVSKEALQEQLNKLGQIGWELVTLQHMPTATRLVMKRQM